MPLADIADKPVDEEIWRFEFCWGAVPASEVWRESLVARGPDPGWFRECSGCESKPGREQRRKTARAEPRLAALIVCMPRSSMNSLRNNNDVAAAQQDVLLVVFAFDELFKVEPVTPNRVSFLPQDLYILRFREFRKAARANQ